MAGATSPAVPGFDFASMVNPLAGIAGQALSGALAGAPSNAESAYTGGNVSIGIGGFQSPNSGNPDLSANGSPDAGAGFLGLAGTDFGSRVMQGILITLVSGLVYQLLKRGKV